MPLATNKIQERVLADVAQYGWHIIHVPTDAKGPGWSFTIGLFQSFKHPELIIFGLSTSVAQTILNDVGHRIQEGARFSDKLYDEEVLTDYAVYFSSVSSKAYADYVGYAIWFYGGEHFPLLQIAWPDKNGFFPWQEEYDKSVKQSQPIL